MKQRIMTKGLAGGTLFRILFTGFFITLTPIFIISGIAGIFGHPFSFDHEPMTGIKGFLVSLWMCLVFPAGFSALIWIPCMLGQWVYAKFRPIPIEYNPIEIGQSLDTERQPPKL